MAKLTLSAPADTIAVPEFALDGTALNSLASLKVIRNADGTNGGAALEITTSTDESVI